MKYEILTWTGLDVHALNMAIKRFNRPLIVEVDNGNHELKSVVIVETKHRDEAKAIFRKFLAGEIPASGGNVFAK